MQDDHFLPIDSIVHAENCIFILLTEFIEQCLLTCFLVLGVKSFRKFVSEAVKGITYVSCFWSLRLLLVIHYSVLISNIHY